jgi:hypothetical protein
MTSDTGGSTIKPTATPQRHSIPIADSEFLAPSFWVRDCEILLQPYSRASRQNGASRRRDREPGPRGPCAPCAVLPPRLPPLPTSTPPPVLLLSHAKWVSLIATSSSSVPRSCMAFADSFLELLCWLFCFVRLQEACAWGATWRIWSSLPLTLRYYY